MELKKTIIFSETGRMCPHVTMFCFNSLRNCKCMLFKSVVVNSDLGGIILLFFFLWRWKQNGADIDFTMSYHYRLDGGSLAISSPRTDQDIGTYQCLATNSLGTILSQKAKLQFACEFVRKIYNLCVSENIFLL